MNGSQKKVLDAIFTTPTPSVLEWRKLESLLIAVGAEVVEGRGSRVRFMLNGVVATFHRPHPSKEAKPYQIKDAKEFLQKAGISS